MKKYLWILSSFLLGLVCISSCSKDDDDAKNAKSYLTVQNATYNEATFPAATAKYKLKDVSVSGTAKPGGVAIIKVVSDKPYKRFFIGVKGINGYWSYTPSNSSSQRRVKALASNNDDEYEYEIPINYASENNSSFTTLLSAEDEDGEITEPYEEEINMVDVIFGGKVTSMSWQGQDIINFKYDGQGRMISADANNVRIDNVRLEFYGPRFEISYNPLKIKINDEGDIEEFYNVQTNSKGFVTKMFQSDLELTFSYDDQGHLIKWESIEHDSEGTWYSVYTYTWSNGNLVKFKANVDNGEEVYESSATYSQYVNYASQWTLSEQTVICFLSGLEASGLFGYPCYNLPIKTVSDDGETNTWSYTFNDDSTIKTEIMDGWAEIEYHYGGNSANLAPKWKSTYNPLRHKFLRHHKEQLLVSAKKSKTF